MGSLFLLSKFESKHGTGSVAESSYSLKIGINAQIVDGFVGNIDHDEFRNNVESVVQELRNNYLDSIVGRATNENIVTYILWQIYKICPKTIVFAELVQNEKFGVMASSEEIDLSSYESELYYKLGASNLIRNNYNDAEKYFDKAQSLTINSLRVFIGKGRCLFKSKRYKSCEEHFLKGIDLFPESSEIYRNLGNAYLEQNNLTEAIKHLKHSVNLTPRSAIALNNLGYAYLLKTQYNDALKCQNVAIEIDSKMWEAYLDRAESNKMLGNDLLAEKDVLLGKRLKEKYGVFPWEWLKLSSSTGKKD